MPLQLNGVALTPVIREYYQGPWPANLSVERLESLGDWEDLPPEHQRAVARIVLDIAEYIPCSTMRNVLSVIKEDLPTSNEPNVLVNVVKVLLGHNFSMHIIEKEGGQRVWALASPQKAGAHAARSAEGPDAVEMLR